MLEYAVYSIKLEFTKKVLGGIPADAGKAAKWAEDKNIPATVFERMKENKSAGDYYLVRDSIGPYIPDKHVKAHLRDKLVAMEVFDKELISRKISIMATIVPRIIRFYRDDEIITKCEGLEEVKGVYYEYIDAGARITFVIAMPKPVGFLNSVNISRAFTIGQNSGFGTIRNSYGMYNLIGFENQPSVEIEPGENIEVVLAQE